MFTGCTGTTIKDEIFYALKTNGRGAFEAHTLTTYTRDLTQAQWDSISPGMLCTSIQAFGDMKAAIETLCSQAGGFLSPACSYDTTQATEMYYDSITKLSAKARKSK